MAIRQSLIPTLRYQDAHRAIGFLEALGFERHALHIDPDDPTIVAHAQLVLDGCMIMVSSARMETGSRPFQWLQPSEVGGVTMSTYVVVDDIAALQDCAEAAGAEFITRLHDNDGYPGRSFDIRDPGAHIWHFGTYDPWTPAP